MVWPRLRQSDERQHPFLLEPNERDPCIIPIRGVAGTVAQKDRQKPAVDRHGTIHTFWGFLGF